MNKSIIFTLSGHSSILSHKFNFPVYLDEDPSLYYGIGLPNCDTFNLIPNTESTNNVIVWEEKDEYRSKIPMGSLELNDLSKTIIENNLQNEKNIDVTLVPNIHTATITIRTIHSKN